MIAFLICLLAQDPIVAVQTETSSGLASVVEKESEHEGPKGGYLGKAVTAAHVIDGASEITVTYSDGQRGLNCQIVSVDKVNDVAVIRVWVPAKVKPIRVALAEIVKGQPVRMIGKKARLILANAADPTTGDLLYADVRLYPGDSGGPVLNENGELVGAISGGWFWYKIEGDQSTWPARGSNLKPLRKLLD